MNHSDVAFALYKELHINLSLAETAVWHAGRELGIGKVRDLTPAECDLLESKLRLKFEPWLPKKSLTAQRNQRGEGTPITIHIPKRNTPMSDQTNTQRKLFKVTLPSVINTMVLRLGSKPEMRYTPNGTQVANFRGVASRRYQDKDQNWVSQDAWYRINVWREAAERLNAKNLEPGDIVLVEFNPADIKVNAYLDKDGKPAGSIDLTAQRVSVIATNSEATTVTETAPVNEEEIPF